MSSLQSWICTGLIEWNVKNVCAISYVYTITFSTALCLTFPLIIQTYDVPSAHMRAYATISILNNNCSVRYSFKCHTSLTIVSSFWLFLVNEVYLFHISFRIVVLQWKYQRVECVDTDMEPLSDICWPRSTYHGVTGTELTRCSCWVYCYCLTFVYGNNYIRVFRDHKSHTNQQTAYGWFVIRLS